MGHPSSISEHPPSLRLVRSADGLCLDAARARREVEEENRLAAALARRQDERAAEDVRHIFAVRASRLLEGGRAAILPPARRRWLVNEARRFGLRAFEANLIIAVVQDAARRGEAPDATPTRTLLQVIPTHGAREHRQLVIQRLIVAALIAAGAVAMLARWVAGS